MILFRADASHEIGTGHIMRCLALAQRCAAMGERTIIMSCQITSQLKTRLESEGLEFIELNSVAGTLDDAEQTGAVAKRFSVSWIVLDGYQFNSGYQRRIKDLGCNLLVIDDNGHSNHYFSDIVLNQNIHASEKLYSNREPYTRLLLGTSYALLREEFLRWQSWKRIIPESAQNILVTLGGSDPENVTLKIIHAIKSLKLSSLNTIVVIAENQDHDKIKSLIAKSSVNITIKSNVSKMSDLMAWADIAISAGGTSTLELAFMGLPFITIAIADNQNLVVEEFGKRDIAVNLGWHAKVTPLIVARTLSDLIGDGYKRMNMSMRARCLVDGNGASRVCRELRNG